MADILSRLGPALEGRYRIERELGEGGMATVFLAQDLKHDRKVALKVLKPELAAMVGVDRFLAEIRTTANLSHPHILPLHDSGEADSYLYYVMPYLEGESLRDRLGRERQLSIEEAVRIATDVAGALDYAHRHGVVHRDIKPANIMLQDGRPVIADFGIALAVGAAGTDRLTETGLSVGTPFYMSPEQATGDRPVGPASDFYSLGCVLYEMLVGDPPYMASTAQAVLGKILLGDVPSATAIRSTVPPNVDAAIRRALERTPADRFPSGSAFAAALADDRFRHGAGADVGGGRASRVALFGVGVVALVAGLVLGRGLLSDGSGASAPVVRYQPTFRYDERPVPINGATLDLSHDGEHLVYVGVSASGTQLFVRDRDALVSRPVPETEGARRPTFSPDGTRVAFVTADGQLKTIAMDGSQPVTLVDSGVENFEVSWEADGYVYFDTFEAPGLLRVAAAGGRPPEPVFRGEPELDDLIHGAMGLLPGGEAVLVNVVRNIGRNSVGVIDLASGTLTHLVDGNRGVYAPTGHLVYFDVDGSLTAHPFDADRRALTGDPVVLRELGTGALDLSLSGDGRLVYSRIPPAEHRVVWVDRAGGETRLDDDDPVTGARFVRLSPDGARLAVSTLEEEGRDLGQVWVKELPEGPLTRLTQEGETNFRPAWDLDHASLFFISDRSGKRAVWRRRADGSGEPEGVLERDLPVDEVEVSEDGEWMIYREGSQDGQRTIRARRMDDERSDLLVAGGRFDAFAPALSPDGRWLAHGARVNGSFEVYVRPFPTGEGQWRITPNGGGIPRWASNGRELFFPGGNDSLNVVDVTVDGDTPRFSEPRGLFPSGPYRLEGYHASYDVSADGQRFVMVRRRSQDVDTQEIVVVENFLTELSGSVPPG